MQAFMLFTALDLRPISIPKFPGSACLLHFSISPVVMHPTVVGFLLLQRFCTYTAEGSPRVPPFNLDLTAEDGFDLAVQVIEWVGKNMPGWYYSRKAIELVC